MILTSVSGLDHFLFPVLLNTRKGLIYYPCTLLVRDEIESMHERLAELSRIEYILTESCFTLKRLTEELTTNIQKLSDLYLINWNGYEVDS